MHITFLVYIHCTYVYGVFLLLLIVRDFIRLSTIILILPFVQIWINLVWRLLKEHIVMHFNFTQ